MIDLTSVEKYGDQEPTKSFYKEGLKSFLDVPEVAEELGSFGMKLYPWQEMILRSSLSVKGGSLYYSNVGLSVPRQNGKSEVIVWRSIVGMLFLSQKILYTSYNKDSARAIYRRMQDLLEEYPKLNSFIEVGDQHNKMEFRAFDPRTGEELGSMEFHTRAGGKARGESYDLIFFDESQFLTSGQVSSVTPTTATFTDAQIWYAGTPEPVDKSVTRGATSGAGGNVFRRVRRDILFKEKEYSCFYEWGVDHMVPKSDKKWWYRTNPSLGFIPSEGRGLTEKSFIADSLSDEEFVVERLGFWSQQDKKSVIDKGLWDTLAVDENVEKEFMNPGNHDGVILAIKSDPIDEFVNVAFGFVLEGDVFVRIADSFNMDSPWAEEVLEIVLKMIEYPKCRSILVDGESAQALVVQGLKRKGKWPRSGNLRKHGKVSLVSSNEVKTSVNGFVSNIVDRKIFHGGQPQVDAAVYDAEKRVRGGSWWGFKSITGRSKAGLLEVLALAVHGYSDAPEVDSDIKGIAAAKGYSSPEWRAI